MCAVLLPQVVFADDAYHYTTTNTTVLSTWPVAGPQHPKVAVPPLNASHPLEMLTTATNIITLRSKLNWIGESSTLLGIISGEGEPGRVIDGMHCSPSGQLAVASAGSDQASTMPVFTWGPGLHVCAPNLRAQQA